MVVVGWAVDDGDGSVEQTVMVSDNGGGGPQRQTVVVGVR